MELIFVGAGLAIFFGLMYAVYLDLEPYRKITRNIHR